MTSLDPLAVSASDRASSEVLVKHQIFEGLVRYDPSTMKPVAALARSWTVSRDAKTFTFVLRNDSRFHNGRTVTPADVVFSLTRLARAACVARESPTAAAPAPLLSVVAGYADASECRTPTLTGVVGTGSRTVVVRLNEAWVDFPATLGNIAASIVPADIVANDELGFGTRPVGTGPYRVDRPWDGRSVRLVRFGSYWGPPAAVGSVAFVAYQDEPSAYVDLLRGRVDYAPVPENRAPEARRRFGDAGFALGTGLHFFGFNLESQRVASPQIRIALSRAVDRASLASAIFRGTREPARSLLPPTLYGARPAKCGDRCSLDVADARKAIRDAHPDGPLEIVVSVSDLGTNPEVAAALARMFAAVGVTARVVQRPFREHLRGLQQGDADVFQLGLIPEYPSPDGLLWPLVRSGARENYMHYANVDVDRLLTEARRTISSGARGELYAAAERRIVHDLPILPLLWFRSSVVFDPALESADGPLVDGLGLTDFARVRFRR